MLETNDSTVQVLDDETLCNIARELVETVRNNVTIDWTLRENVRAKLRTLVKRAIVIYFEILSSLMKRENQPDFSK